MCVYCRSPPLPWGFIRSAVRGRRRIFIIVPSISSVISRAKDGLNFSAVPL
nr:MAG TPA: hypothetical protein [Caudoviricetes sp.]